MADFPNMKQVGADIDNRLTALETNNSSYLTKTVADAAYLGINGKAASASKADTATKATQDGNGSVIATTYCKKSGDNGSITGYSTTSSTASAITITDSSDANINVTGAVAITIADGTAGKSWEKKVFITNASASITLSGANWL